MPGILRIDTDYRYGAGWFILLWLPISFVELQWRQHHHSWSWTCRGTWTCIQEPVEEHPDELTLFLEEHKEQICALFRTERLSFALGRVLYMYQDIVEWSTENIYRHPTCRRPGLLASLGIALNTSYYSKLYTYILINMYWLIFNDET